MLVLIVVLFIFLLSAVAPSPDHAQIWSIAGSTPVQTRSTSRREKSRDGNFGIWLAVHPVFPNPGCTRLREGFLGICNTFSHHPLVCHPRVIHAIAGTHRKMTDCPTAEAAYTQFPFFL
jgi:hypothetical protein